MRRFVYFLPGANGTSEKTLADIGLLDRLTPSWSQGSSCGPGDQDGLFLVRGEWDSRWKYDAQSQAWVRSKDGYWVGCFNASAPRPSDLAREEVVFTESYLVTLSNGEKWEIPTRSGFPSYYGVDPDSGELVMKTCNAYRPLLAQADTVLKWYMWQMGYSKTQASLPVVDACQLFYRLLAVKYRVGPAELDLMGMPQESDYVAALRYFLNAPEIDAQFTRPEASDAVGV